MIQIAVLGYGTVGSGVVEILDINKEIIKNRVGDEINVKYVLDIRDFEGDPIQKKIVHDYNVILEDPEVKVVVEVMGGVEPAYTFVKAALLAGKSAATSNKALVAAKGSELLEIAHEKKVNFLFEASVGGGIPIIRPIMNALTADVITDIQGILNGTTNYMLTKMSKEGLMYDDVLKEAQNKGYAEKDPTADVEGHDACRKIAILSSLAYGRFVDYEDIPVQGISKITDIDFEYANAIGKAIKLIGMSRNSEKGITAMVAPFMMEPEDPLYSVNDVFNAIKVTGNMVGDTMFFGPGAGKLPTASAVLADVIEECMNFGKCISANWEAEKAKLCSVKDMSFRFFVRAKASEKENVLKYFAGADIIELAGHEDELGFLTKTMTEKEFDEKLSYMDGMITVIRGLF